MTTEALTDDVATRQMDFLARRARGLRTRAAAGHLDRWLLIIGGVLMPLGVLLVVLGWVGAARTPLPFEQTDYLISGGLLGLSLVFAGGFVYFAYWETVRIRDGRRHQQHLVEALARLEHLLATNPGQLAATAGVGRAPARSFVATPQGTMFHRKDCAAVVGRGGLVSVDPKKTSLRPCKLCDPLGASSD